jgi:hypothetical protein
MPRKVLDVCDAIIPHSKNKMVELKLGISIRFLVESFEPWPSFALRALQISSVYGLTSLWNEKRA